MSGSRSLEEQLEQLLVRCEEKDAQIEYLKRQLGQAAKNKQREVQSSHSESGSRATEEEVENSQLASSEDEKGPRRFWKIDPHTMDFKVNIPEFEGQLNPDDFMDWLLTVERVFEFKDVPDDMKVKLVALKLRKFASIWWKNVLTKRAQKGKGKIKSWRKMKEKLRTKFLPIHYLQDNYTKFHHLRQESSSVEEYTHEFEKLMMICDIRETENQTVVRYLGGLSEPIRYVVELQQYSTMEEVCMLAHKVELQKKSKHKELPCPTPESYPLEQESHPPPRPQKLPMIPTNVKPNPPLKPRERRRCFKCQGFGHIASDCPNHEVIVWARPQALDETGLREKRSDKEVHLMGVEEEYVEEADEGELLAFRSS